MINHLGFLQTLVLDCNVLAGENFVPCQAGVAALVCVCSCCMCLHAFVFGCLVLRLFVFPRLWFGVCLDVLLFVCCVVGCRLAVTNC